VETATGSGQKNFGAREAVTAIALAAVEGTVSFAGDPLREFGRARSIIELRPARSNGSKPASAPAMLLPDKYLEGAGRRWRGRRGRGVAEAYKEVSRFKAITGLLEHRRSRGRLIQEQKKALV
jgi:hypothetical protein